MSTLRETIRDRFPGIATEIADKGTKRVDITIKPGDLVAAAGILYNDLNLRFIVASCIDTPAGFELLYHFAEDSSGLIVTVRTFVQGKENPTIASLTGLFIGSAWIEREIHEMFGVQFAGHPNLKHLLLAEDWPAGNYPMRNDHGSGTGKNQ